MNTLSCRQAHPADLPAVVDIENQSFSQPWSESALAEELDPGPRRLTLLASRDDEPLGYLMTWLIADEIHILSLATAGAARRQGVAGALLDCLLAHPRCAAARLLTLEVRASNAAALAFYKSRGFREILRRKGYYERPREDAIVMLRFLAEEPPAVGDL